jgi:hypothetical protein
MKNSRQWIPYEDVIFGDVVLALCLGLELLAAVLAGGEEGVLLLLQLRLQRVVDDHLPLRLRHCHFIYKYYLSGNVAKII